MIRLRFLIVITIGILGHAPVALAAVSQSSTQNEKSSEKFFGERIARIEIKGLSRIEKDAILSKIETKVGGVVQADVLRSDIQALFSMGYFDDIEVQAEAAGKGEVALIYVVHERPVIAAVDFEGSERISFSDLKDVIKVKQWSILDYNQVKEDLQRIQKHFEEKGYYLAKVTYEVKSTKPGEVNLFYKVSDYDKVQIKKITFLNNKSFTDSQLKAMLGETKEGSILSFLSGSGTFKESAFKQDLQRLTFWYLEHGYLKFRYTNPTVTISDDKKWVYISIYVEEGDQYAIRNVDFSGELLFSKDELHEDLALVSGETFSVTKRNQDIQRLTEKYQDLGYAFVNVVPKMNIQDEAKVVDLDYSFEKGSLVHIGEINILGNSKTFDKVIRRELKIHEGDLFNGTQLRISRENVERLGYFQPGEVIFNTVSPKGRSDLVNIEITIKERSTGTISLGAGYGSFQGFFFTTQLSEINLFGRGQNLSLAAQYSIQRTSQSLNLGFTDPYAFDTRWSMGFDLYSTLLRIPNRWVNIRSGTDVRFGYPVFDYSTAFITYKFEGNRIIDADQSVSPITIANDTGEISSVTLSFVRDKRNNRFETTGGNYQSASFETAGLGGDKKFLKWVVNNRFYHRVVGDLVFRNSTEIGQIMSIAGEPLPPSQKFYLGGPNNMKGFPLFLLGPTQTLSNGALQPQGGNFEAFTLFELEYPLIKDAGIKLVAFFDAGNTWLSDAPYNQNPFSVIRTDAGFGFRWFSPMGPLRFEWGFPLARRPGEDVSVFQFFIGPPF